MKISSNDKEYYIGGSPLPVAGPDGHAYLACGENLRGWFSTYAAARQCQPRSIVQRCMRDGRNYGTDWTVYEAPAR